jgi:glycosyltransferase involved in cell wall biosynthesis
MPIKNFSSLAFVATSYVKHHDGISIYIENILSELGAHKDIKIDIFVKKSVCSKLKKRAFKDSSHTNCKFIPIKDSSFISSVLYTNYLVNKQKYDLVFSPCLTPIFSFRNKSMKVIHDVTFKVFSHSLSSLKILYKRMLLMLLYFDDFYGYISESTLDQIYTYTNLKKNKKPFLLLSNGIPLSTKEFYKKYIHEIEAKCNSDEMTFLFVGSLNYHKGLDIAIKFVNEVSKSSNRKITLNIVGKETAQSNEIIDKFKNVLNFKLNVTGYISDSDLYHFYAKSKYILCFSHSEGFGLTVVEAASFKVFPLLSDLPIFHELTNNSLFYYSHNTKDINEFTEKFFSIEGNSFENEYTQSLESMVEKYYDMYKASAKKISTVLSSINN